jgi:hypothetical protein
MLHAIPVWAEDNSQMTPLPLIDSRPDSTVFSNADRTYRLGLLLDYVHREGPALVPGLPTALRDPSDYVMHEIKSAEGQMSLTGADAGSGGLVSSLLAPIVSFMTPAEESDPEAIWLTPDYHHMHGILPFDDAVMFGFNYRRVGFIGDRVAFNFHPYYAQSWHSGEGYWGNEISLGFGPAHEKPWGKIVFRYDNGNSDLMGHESGFDMHADFSFDQHLTLTAGEQQNEEGDLGNYVLLRWQLAKFGGF